MIKRARAGSAGRAGRAGVKAAKEQETWPASWMTTRLNGLSSPLSNPAMRPGRVPSA